MKMNKVVLLTILAASASGCTGIVSDPFSKGYIHIAGDEAGMRAFADMQNGLVAQGKASPDAKGPFFAAREVQEKEETLRETSPTFLDNLFSNSDKNSI